MQTLYFRTVPFKVFRPLKGFSVNNWTVIHPDTRILFNARKEMIYIHKIYEKVEIRIINEEKLDVTDFIFYNTTSNIMNDTKSVTTVMWKIVGWRLRERDYLVF